MTFTDFPDILIYEYLSHLSFFSLFLFDQYHKNRTIKKILTFKIVMHYENAIVCFLLARYIASSVLS